MDNLKINEEIKAEAQKIARLEKQLVSEKLKKRKADTRRKIELGGLVIKSGIDGLNKSIILGALIHALKLIENDGIYISIFESIGDNEFLK